MAQKRAFQQFDIKPVGLGAAVLARDGNARPMFDIGFDAVCPEPAHQPETVATALACHRDTHDRMASLGRFIAPTLQQPE